MVNFVTSNPTWTIPHELITVSRLWIRFLFQLLSRKLNWIWNNSIRMIFLVMTNIENHSKAQSKTEPPFPLKSKYYFKSKQIQFFLVCTSLKTGSKLHIGVAIIKKYSGVPKIDAFTCAQNSEKNPLKIQPKIQIFA